MPKITSNADEEHIKMIHLVYSIKDMKWKEKKNLYKKTHHKRTKKNMIVHLLSGHNISVVVSDEEKVSTVKKRIQQLIGKPFDRISLVHNGVILDDDASLSVYGRNQRGL